MEPSLRLICGTMKNELGMTFRKVSKVPKTGNTERCLVLRQQYALRMLPLLENGRRIINIDESWLNETTFYRKLWRPMFEDNSVPSQNVTPRISVIAAIDTDGNLWFALTQANTDSNVMLMFLRLLMQKLDHEVPGWREDSVLLFDGARYHTSPEMKHYM